MQKDIFVAMTYAIKAFKGKGEIALAIRRLEEARDFATEELFECCAKFKDLNIGLGIRIMKNPANGEIGYIRLLRNVPIPTTQGKSQTTQETYRLQDFHKYGPLKTFPVGQRRECFAVVKNLGLQLFAIRMCVAQISELKSLHETYEQEYGQGTLPSRKESNLIN